MSKKRLYSIGIKLLIAILFCWSIIWQIFHKEKLTEAWTTLQNEWQNANKFYLIAALILMLLNWSIEALKWKLLIKKMQPITFWQSLKGVWCGVTVGTFTPNRVGEFGGRIIYLQNHQRIKGIVVTLIGSFGQIIVTLTTGIAAAYIFILRYLNFKLIREHETLLLKSTLLISIILLITFILLIYFNLNLIENLIQRIPFLRKTKKYFAIVSTFGYLDLTKLLLLSYIRFGVFTIQYFLLLRFFGIQSPFITSVFFIALVFFVQTIIPTFTITEVGVRGKISTFFFSYILPASANFGIVYASSCLWVINLILPAIFGAIFLLRKKIEE